MAHDELMTVAEVAEVLKLNQQTVRNWIDAGKLPAHHLGRRVRVRRADFERIVTEAYSGPRAPGLTAQTGTIWDGEVPAPIVPSDR